MIPNPCVDRRPRQIIAAIREDGGDRREAARPLLEVPQIVIRPTELSSA